MLKKIRLSVLILEMFLMAFVMGCSEKDNTMEKVRDLDFTIIGMPDVPEELQKLVEEKKKEPFKLTYSDDKNLYITVGYGEQSSGGYSITVKQLYLSPNSIILDTELLGPGNDSVQKKEVSYPYIIIKTEYLEEPVIFQ